MLMKNHWPIRQSAWSNDDLGFSLVIIVFGLLFFIPFNGGVPLFDWDEINFAEAAREMLVSHDYLGVQINFLPFWEKPPLFIWMQALSMKAFGVNAFAARFPNAIGGIVSLLVLYHMGRKAFDRRFARLWVLFYAGSLLPFFYFKSGIIDPWFNLFILLGIWFLIKYVSRSTLVDAFVSSLFTGAAILTKGPVGLLIVGLTAFIWMLVSRNWKLLLNGKFLLVYLLGVVLAGGSWFFLQALEGRSYLIVDFFNYQVRLFSTQDAGHGGFLLYHFVVLLFGVFPASVFALPAFRKFSDQHPMHLLTRNWMMILFWTVLILFTIVKTKIVHYSSMCYYPLTFLAAYYVWKNWDKKPLLPKWGNWLFGIFAVLDGSLIILLSVFVKFKDQIIAKGWIHDPYAVANMQASVHWSGYEFLIGVFMIVALLASFFMIKKKMWRLIAITASMVISMMLAMIVLVPKVEGYSQHAAIAFYQEKAQEDCYVETWGFKSYAQYFYTNKPLPENRKSLDKDWLLKGVVDKPVYMVTKITSANEFQQKFPGFRRLYEKNGFVFFKREK
jgi:4-amino-4-deoxy-L-arabinose transferase-like glycosyltransferase